MRHATSTALGALRIRPATASAATTNAAHTRPASASGAARFRSVVNAADLADRHGLTDAADNGCSVDNAQAVASDTPARTTDGHDDAQHAAETA